MSITGLFANPRMRFALIASAFAIKAVVMTLTPMSLDLSFVMSKQVAPWAMTPYGELLSGIVAFWRVIPVDHPEIGSVWTTHLFVPSVGLYVLVFLVKLPLLLLDGLTGLVLQKISFQLRLKDDGVVLLLWFLNPYVTLLNEMWAAIDLLPTLLVLLAVFLALRGKVVSSAVALGTGVAAKLFPVLLIPAFLPGKKRGFSILQISTGVLGAVAYFAWVSHAGYDPWLQLTRFDVYTQYFNEFTAQTTPLSTSGILEAHATMLGVATLVLVATYFLILKFGNNQAILLDSALLTLLLLLAFTNWSPQFIIWLIPFLTVQAVRDRRSSALMTIILTSAFIVSLLAFPSYFTANGNGFFFFPSQNNETFKYAATTLDILARDDLVQYIAVPIARAVFSSTCLVYSLKLVQRNTRLLSTFLSYFTPPR